MEASDSFWLWKNLENAAFQILGFRRGRKDWMIASLRPVFDLTKLNAGIFGSILDDVQKCCRENMLGTGASDQKTSWTNHLHGAKIDFLITFGCSFHSGSGFGEGRWIQNDGIVLDTLAAFFTEQIKCIGLYKRHPVR